MKMKWNILTILALVFMLVGGNVAPVRAEGTTITGLTVYDIDGNVRATSVVGEYLYAKAVLAGLPEGGVECQINFQGGEGGIIGIISADGTCNSGYYQYPSPGTYTVTMRVYSYATGTLLVESSITHVVTYGIGDIVWVDNFTHEPTTAPLIGQWYTIKAPVMGYYQGMTCSVSFGDGTDVGGTFTTEGDKTWCSAENYYYSPGTFTIEFYVFAPPPNDLTPLASKSAEFVLAEPNLGIGPIWVFGTNNNEMLASSFTNQELQALGLFINGMQYALVESCTIDYGDGSGAQAGVLSGWPANCQGPVHAYTTPDTYPITVTVTGFDGTTASESLPFLVLTAPVLEQLPDESFGVVADSSLWSNLGFCGPDNPCSAADDFIVPESTTLTIGQIQLWGVYFSFPDDLPYTDDFTVIIHENMIQEDNSEIPGQAIYTGNHVQSTKVPTGETVNGGSEYVITLTLADPQTLPAGKYWLEIYNNGGFGSPVYPTSEAYGFFGWVGGFPDTLGMGPDGSSIYYANPTSESSGWQPYPGNNMSLRLFTAEAAPTTHSISGTVFHDTNGNGIWDHTGEYPEYAYTNGYIELNQDCDEFNTFEDEFDKWVYLDESGGFSFTDVPGGNTYCVGPDPSTHFVVTTEPVRFEPLDADHTDLVMGMRHMQFELDRPIPEGKVGEVYEQTFTISGGQAPYTIVSASENELPAGISYAFENDTLTLTGTPELPGWIHVSLLLEDANGVRDEMQATSRVRTDAGLTLTSSENPSTPGQPVTFTFTTNPPDPSWDPGYTPAGSVTFYVNGEPIDPSCTGIDVYVEWVWEGSGDFDGYWNYQNTATCTSTLLEGSYDISVEYTSYNYYYDATTHLTQNVQEPVPYQSAGLGAPLDLGNVLNTAKAGQMIPLKWQLLDGFGNPVTNLDPASVTMVISPYTCPSGVMTDAIEIYATGTSTLQNLGDGYYQLNWKTDKGYVNSCRKLTLKIGDWSGDGFTALFQFRK